MTKDYFKVICDQCGKETDYILCNSTFVEGFHPLDDWHNININRREEAAKYQDFCSSDCVKAAIDDK